MEINVTQILSEDCALLSASQAELGSCAGKITWRNSLALAELHPLISDANRDEVRDHFRAYGAWDADEINAWTDQELSAMVWQEVAAGVREFTDHCDSDLDTYRAECERGSISGRVYFSDDGAKAWIYLGV